MEHKYKPIADYLDW